MIKTFRTFDFANFKGADKFTKSIEALLRYFIKMKNDNIMYPKVWIEEELLMKETEMEISRKRFIIISRNRT